MELKYLIIPKMKTFSKESTRKQESLKVTQETKMLWKQEEKLMRRKKFTVKGTIKWPNKIAMKSLTREAV